MAQDERAHHLLVRSTCLLGIYHNGNGRRKTLVAATRIDDHRQLTAVHTGIRSGGGIGTCLILDADVAILGHTDNVGTEKANQSVSEKRAKAVADCLAEQGVGTQIKDVLGMSYNQPIASNDTEEGKAQNRRVEVYMYASQEMIDAANAEAAN